MNRHRWFKHPRQGYMLRFSHAPTWDSLRAFVGQRIRLDGANYSDAASYRADRKRIDRDRVEAREMIQIAETAGIDPGSVPTTRLTWDAATGWDYTPGQYYPTEVFGAVSRAVTDAIWQTTFDQIHAAGGEPNRNAIVREARNLATNARAQEAVTRWFV